MRAGRYSEANARLERGAATAAKFQDVWSTAFIDYMRGTAAVERGDWAGAVEGARRVDTVAPRIAGNPRRIWMVLSPLLTGVAEVRAGRADSARRLLDQLRQTVLQASPPSESWAVKTLEGEIALASGDAAAAEEAFTAAAPPIKMFFSTGSPSSSVAWNAIPFRDGLARAQLAQGNVDGAIESYRGLLTPDVSQKWTAVLEPRLVLQLARALERKGDRAAAADEYRRFLDLWARADAGLPEVAEARQKVQRLR
jgi:tetratricopeptide (TPR) repeat protein